MRLETDRLLLRLPEPEDADGYAEVFGDREVVAFLGMDVQTRQDQVAGIARMSFDRLDPAGIYLGTQSGSVWVSPDTGGEWIEAASYLPTILSVEAAEWR